VQNGVLKSLSFMFEYIGEMGKDYIYAVAPLLEDALMDRDLVHRQTAMAVLAHMSLGVFGFGCEDALVHLLNHAWPNIFETSPHVIQAFMAAVEGFRVGVGPVKLLFYTLQVSPPPPQLSPLPLPSPASLHLSSLSGRACSTRRGRCATSTGRCTTICTSVRRTRSSPATRASPTTARTSTPATSSSTSSRPRPHLYRHSPGQPPSLGAGNDFWCTI